ncbi:hypothetical protein [Jonesia quinghaiensis]|uniref:hypothetical protein n=1 Tax=Jonesia quinghaiensis TaxID=262806 RepID=UPI00040983E2|nr:hypothetical protein [Jonesia quinghaiensis]
MPHRKKTPQDDAHHTPGQDAWVEQPPEQDGEGFSTAAHILAHDDNTPETDTPAS